MSDLRLCVDVGSTVTKACLVDVGTASVLARASHRTTLETDVLDGYAACRAALAEQVPGAEQAEVLACSSAGGGLRIAVVGNEALVTSEAGRRVALSSGGKVVDVTSGPLTTAAVTALLATEPDVVLLVGGTDGGNAEVLLHNAEVLAAEQVSLPVVAAGNADATDGVVELLAEAKVPTLTCANVMPRIGAFAPGPAREAVRAMFLAHVIGGKHLSASPEFAAMVRGATPDVVLAAVEVLSVEAGDVLVVDVGGATTDVYSVVEVDPEALGRDVVGLVPATRTVEGDLGMRWSAASTVEAARAAGLVSGEGDEAAAVRAAGLRPGDVAASDGPQEVAAELALAGWAAGLAVRRHAGRAEVRYENVGGSPSRVVERSGVDLREVGLVVGSGGVLRHAPDAAAATSALTRHLGPAAAAGWQVPTHARVVVDTDYLLLPAGLLAEEHRGVAEALLHGLLRDADEVAGGLP